MNILVDENIPRMTVAALRQLGHDVKDNRGTEVQGPADSAPWAMAISERRLLITTDKGFARYRETTHHGVLIIRLRQPNRQKIHDRVMLAIHNFRPEDWRCLFVVMRDRAMSTSRVARDSGESQ